VIRRGVESKLGVAYPDEGEVGVWVVRVGGDDGELLPWHYIYEGRKVRWGTPTMALHIMYIYIYI